MNRLLVLACLVSVAHADDGSLPPLTDVRVESSLDGTEQPSRLWMPDAARKRPTPLMVRLHSWSGDYTQDNAAWFREAVEREWIYLHPNFRGRNDHPEACGSKLARRDVLDAIDWVSAKYEVDPSRVYLCGVSGGGHMTMLMAGHHPDRFSAASAWVGIGDLAAWYRFHTRGGTEGRYAKMIVASLGGPPGTSDEIDERYEERSPLTHFGNVGDLPLDLNAGVTDGKTGSVPISQTINAFNWIAQSKDRPKVTRAEYEQLRENGRLDDPGEGEDVVDPLYERRIHLRRHAGETRVTIFEGGHEGIAHAACGWLSKQRRKTTE